MAVRASLATSMCVCRHVSHVPTAICYAQSRFFNNHCPDIAFNRGGKWGNQSALRVSMEGEEEEKQDKAEIRNNRRVEREKGRIEEDRKDGGL